jgi:ABC-type transporter Mla MlaB component
MTRCLPDEDFAVFADRRSSDCRVLVARGPLTAAGGELLYCAISTACKQEPDGHLVTDLTAVTAVDPAGWAWLLPALQECQAAGCQLRILPPRVGITGPTADRSTDPPARLRCYPDGPILVRGDFEMVDRAGNDLPRTRSVVALCRCGNSAIKPFCDGSHKITRFTDG